MTIVMGLFAITFLFLSFPVQAKKEICPQVIIHGNNDIVLSDTEKRMVCGDPELNAYKNIPPYEARFFFTGILQSRGFLSPQFETKTEVLHVHPGKKFYLKKIKVISSFRKEKRIIAKELRRLFERKLLATDLLNVIEAEALGLLRENGHPCSKVKVEVDISQSLVMVHLNNLRRFDFGTIDKEKINGLRDNALDRYYPFKSEQTFDEDLLSLTEKRMLRSEVVSGTYFLENCSQNNDSFSLSQHFIIGPPRTIRFGVGASTEMGPMTRIRWSNNRYKSMASLLSANIRASFREQTLNLTSDSFFWKHEPRRSLFSQFEISRESQIDFEELLITLKPLMKWTRDIGQYHHTYLLGPSYEAGTYHSKENIDTKSFSTGLLSGGIQLMSHSYEHYDIHPEAGDLFALNFDLRDPKFGFQESLLKLDSTFVKLARISNWGRGTLVGGVRLNAGTTWVSDDVSLNGLPPTVKFYGGGSDDLRGFHLKTLPQNDGLGALSKIGTKLELRRTYLVKESIEGFSFLDLSYFGTRSWELDPQLFYSPGIGLRWLSPIGLVQGFAARAYRTDPYQDLGSLLYLGIGGVF